MSSASLSKDGKVVQRFMPGDGYSQVVQFDCPCCGDPFQLLVPWQRKGVCPNCKCAIAIED